MEIALLDQNALRIKGKKSALLVDVMETQKTEANAYLFLTQDFLKAKQGKGELLISGPGEYEVSGTKIAASVSSGDVLYHMTIDDIKILLTKVSTFVRAKDTIEEQNIVVLFTDEMIDQSALTNAQPGVVVCYGDKALEASTNLGKGLNKKDQESEALPDASIKPTDKFTISAEKLPTEMQVVLLAQ